MSDGSDKRTYIRWDMRTYSNIVWQERQQGKRVLRTYWMEKE